ncbi:CPP1-like family protein [Chamaesiphon sp. OTE_20_metabat_361]|uniref:CPP1-like family protein n=1 Tax=Chamaesiphon sp. OTE_20_metabat_361 TaxID=2964689 RepID=UPI00286B03B9|nr:CPP1-like family protein [Chamaesiphon sp. OTE_20_metabat_361]
MSQQNPYEQLGVAQDATFEEIQAAKQRVIAQVGSDRQLQDNVEAAYDAILMERLKLRQQGKIKVPDGIRFPEKLPNVVPKFTSLSGPNSPSWVRDTFERPDRSQILTTSGVYAALLAAILVPTIASSALPTIIAFGIGFCLYFVNQKQRRFKRAVLGSLTAAIVGTAIAAVMVNYLHMPTEQLIGIHGEVFAGVLVLVMLWAVSSFTK